MQVDIREIQPGWEVCDNTGTTVATVVATEGNYLHVKTGGLLAKEYYIPAAAVEEIEAHRVEIRVAKSDLGNQGWDKAPADAVPSGSSR
jgi:hypothetical protein